MITHLEPDILECKVKWALGNITTKKASGGDGIAVELFQVLKDDALNRPANLENSAMATGLEKVSFHSKSKEEQCQIRFKILHNCTHLTRYKLMLKILQARLKWYMNQELPDVQTRFRKGRGTGDQIVNIYWIIKKENSRKTPTSASLTMPKPLTVWITTNCGKFLNRWEYQTTLCDTQEICLQVKKQQLELDMKQQTVSKCERSTLRLLCCHPAYLTYTQSTSCEMPGWMKHKLESRLPGEISLTSDMQIAPSLWQKVKRN